MKLSLASCLLISLLQNAQTRKKTVSWILHHQNFKPYSNPQGKWQYEDNYQLPVIPVTSYTSITTSYTESYLGPPQARLASKEVNTTFPDNADGPRVPTCWHLPLQLPRTTVPVSKSLLMLATLPPDLQAYSPASSPGCCGCPIRCSTCPVGLSLPCQA